MKLETWVQRFKGSIACGVQLLRVQLPAAFKGSIGFEFEEFEEFRVCSGVCFVVPPRNDGSQ
jgi:hypothetical protein